MYLPDTCYNRTTQPYAESEKKRTTREAARAPEWGFAVRLANGQRLYYSIELDPGGEPEWTPRVNQARRLASATEAQKEAAPMLTSRDALEYEVLRLPQP